MTTRRPTIHDVARQAGVASSTVSKVMNGSQKLRKETEEKVRKAVSELGFEPNPYARTITTGRSQTIGVILLDILNPHFTAIAKGVGQVASVAGYMVLVGDTDEDPAREAHLIRTLRARTDGLILSGSRLPDEQLQELYQPDQPLVLVGRQPSGPIPSVTVDEFAAALGLTTYLIAQGARRIVYLAGPGFWVNQERERGYRATMERAGLQPQTWALDSVDHPGGERIIPRFLATEPRPDALICYNELAAGGVIRGLNDLGVRVPEQVAVVSFSSNAQATRLPNASTHMELPSRELGMEATRTLIELLAGRPPAQLHQQLYAHLKIARSAVNPSGDAWLQAGAMTLEQP